MPVPWGSRLGDLLARSVVGRRERDLLGRGDRSRRIGASRRQSLVEVIQRLNRRRLGGGIEGDSRATDGDRRGDTRSSREREDRTTELAGVDVRGSGCARAGTRADESCAGLGAVARGLLQRLVGDRLRGIDQL